MQQQSHQFYIFVLGPRVYEWLYSYSCNYYQADSYSFCSDISTDLYTNFYHFAHDALLELRTKPELIWGNSSSSRKKNFQKTEKLLIIIIKMLDWNKKHVIT
jgi:hypothetical protein